MRKLALIFLSIILSAFMQSCSSALEGEWTCTDAQADGKNFDELRETVQSALKSNLGTSLKVEGSEYVRKQGSTAMVIFNKGTFTLSNDDKVLSLTNQKIASGGDATWQMLPKELRIPVTYDVLTLTDKELKIRIQEKNIYGELFVFTYTKK